MHSATWSGASPMSCRYPCCLQTIMTKASTWVVDHSAPAASISSAACLCHNQDDGGVWAATSAAAEGNGLTLGKPAPLVSAAAIICSAGCVEWLPKYGCALLALKGPDPEAGQDVRIRQANERLLLVGLDKWTFGVHRCVMLHGFVRGRSRPASC